MDIGVISVRYARALLGSATKLGCEDRVYTEMQALADNYTQLPDLRFTINNPMLQKSTKQHLLETACGGTVADLTRKFIALVLKEDREGVMQFIANSYATLYREQKHITRGKLVTAVPVSEDTESRMKAMVQEKTHGTVEFNTETDPTIIGGFVLEYDTYRMDASVKAKLQKILKELKK